jgi:hypothetical protein
MALTRASSQFQTKPPAPTLLEPMSRKDLGDRAGTARLSEFPTRSSPALTSIALWFTGGLLLGALAALWLMPGMWAILIPSSPQPPNSNVYLNRFSEPSLLPSLLGQPTFVLSLFLSLAPLLGAIVLVAAPRLRNRKKSAEEQLAKDKEPEGTLEESPTVANKPAKQQPVEGQESKTDTPPGEELEEGLEEATDDEEEEGIESGREKDEEDKEKEEEEEEEEDEEDEEEEDEEKEEEEGPVLGDLASLFEEEDTSLSSLEGLSKELPEINVDELLASSGETSLKLREANVPILEEIDRHLINDEIQRL